MQGRKDVTREVWRKEEKQGNVKHSSSRMRGRRAAVKGRVRCHRNINARTCSLAVTTSSLDFCASKIRNGNEIAISSKGGLP